MFRVTHPNASKLKRVLQVLTKISDEVPFFITQDALEVKVISPDKTVMGVFRAPSIIFEEYSVEGEESFIVSGTELKKAVKRAGRNDAAVFELDRESGVLKLTLRDRKTGLEREIGVPLIPKPVEPLPELQVDLSVTFTMLSQDFKNIVSDLKLVGDEAIFTYEAGKITIISTEQQKEYKCDLAEGNPLIILSSTVEKARSSYSIDLLVEAARPASATKNITISFDTSKPMKVEYDIGDGSKLIYWLVPRI
ncbi:MAG: DNA polymerase sliding clamp [Desulfurococcaceae archaeon]|nr:DNA polymerase sliding clamp [Desulfurococcaceae archaeon]